MIYCQYGCGQEALYQLKNGKWCCSKSKNSCPYFKEKVGNSRKGELHPLFGKEPWNKGKTNIYSDEVIEKMRNSNIGKKLEEITKNKIRDKLKGRKPWNHGKKGYKRSEEFKSSQSKRMKGVNNLTIEKINEKYPLFSKIEEMRYDPYDLGKKVIQVHCKNHNCPNSKEKGGWFTPTKSQITERIRGTDKFGNDGSYFYCSEECKTKCPLYNNRGNDPFKIKNDQYTKYEYQVFREFVLDRDDHICQYCGEEAIHVHHERPQKLEPFFALDPDYAWSCCEKCHYEKGHKDECNTKIIADTICGDKK